MMQLGVPFGEVHLRNPAVGTAVPVQSWTGEAVQACRAEPSVSQRIGVAWP
jgi:hypothetical protein